MESEVDDLKAISEKLEIVNLQLAQRKTTRRKTLYWLLISLCAVIVLTAIFRFVEQIRAHFYTGQLRMCAHLRPKSRRFAAIFLRQRA